MNFSGAEVLANPKPSGHIVYPYTTGSQVAEAVALFAGVGLERGESVLLVMKEAHRQPIRQRLEQRGFNLSELEATGTLVCEDAQKLLATFMFDGIIDEHRFKTTIGQMIQNAKRNGAGLADRPVRVFGEMVDLIWKSHLRSTERLEQLWNDVIREHSVPLLCAYSLAGSKPNALPVSLLCCHSESIA
jgi:hypothetical protein